MIKKQYHLNYNGCNMKFIKNAIIGIIKWASRPGNAEIERDYAAEKSKALYNSSTIGSSKVMSQGDSIDGTNSMNFTVFPAIGGKVIQIRSYDPRLDRHVGSLYVITDQEDLGEELGQIITRESLSR